MKHIKKNLKRILFPHPFFVIVLTIISAVSLTYVFTSGNQNSVLAYISYAVSFYALTVTVCRTPYYIQKFKKTLNANPYIKRYISVPEHRARVSLQISLLINAAYSVFKFSAGIYYDSFWFGAEAVYYLILGIMRYFIVKKDRAKQKSAGSEWKTYRLCGYLMLLLNLIMSVITTQIVLQNKSYIYSGLIIYATAAYTFYRLTVAIINVIKFNPRKYSLLSASKLLNLCAALMSLFALQTAMLTQFGGNDGITSQILNAATGSAVSIIAVLTALFMIIDSSKKIKAFDNDTSSQ